jgi:hypothetical protein
MKEEYYKDYLSKVYVTYDDLSKSYSINGYVDINDKGSYQDLVEQIGNYYNDSTFQEESKEQKDIRLAKEKAEKRNNKIDQLLND